MMCATIAAILIALIGLITASGIGRTLSRFRRDAEALAAGEGDTWRHRDKDHLDAVAAIFNDLHERLEAMKARQIKEEELVAARRYADNVIKSMFDVLIVTDADLRIQTANKAACELLEYTELELVGRPIETLFREEPTLLGTPIAEELRSNQMRDFEATYQTKRGRFVPVLLSASADARQRRPAAGVHHRRQGHHRAQADGTGIARRQGDRRSRQPRKSRIRGQHEPRNPHADDRDPRLCGSADAPDAGRRRPPPLHPDHPPQRRASADGHQRHSRRLQDRSRQDDRRAHPLLAGADCHRCRGPDEGARGR